MLYLRYYSKFDGTFDITGSSHNGGGISAHYFVNGQRHAGHAGGRHQQVSHRVRELARR